VTSEVGSRGGRSVRKSYSDRLTDKKYPESHYPEEPGERKLAWSKKLKHRNPPQFFDKEGRRNVRDEEQFSNGDHFYLYAEDSDEEGFK